MFFTNRNAEESEHRAKAAPPMVIVVDKDDASRTLMATAIAGHDYSVQTTGSAAFVMEQLLHGCQPVIVIGDELEEGINRAKAIELLKYCNPESTIILVSDEISPAEELQMLKQGIYYRIRRPASAMDWAELQWAIDCACNKLDKRVLTPGLLH